ncbi:Hypothetical protein, putative [Bodo saltans]|uniref:Trichohyalin-plectin-homology domain-containing protein n=1 Tax=Bodo saltans TaxID=75058 RepID=A0A0S4J5B5_BODSA|nr:Hypothetical protein, putative [Bodo saltans]|eukprot:CUG84909.1 Hypothetical protein, putative [Bodo saltans]
MSSKLSSSPSRERADANTLLHQLMKRVELARRGKSADLNGSRMSLDEQVRARHEEVKKDTKAGEMLRALRDEEDARRLKQRRIDEAKRKEAVRQAMFDDFENKRSRVYGGKEHWKEASALEKAERDSSIAERRQSVKELRQLHQQQRYFAEERLARERDQQRESRIQQKKSDELYVARREQGRIDEIKSKVNAVKELTRSKQDALDAVYERNREARQHIVAVNEALRRRELRDIADQMSSLQQELSRLH